MMKKLVLFVAAVMLLASSAQAAINNVQVLTTSPTLQREVCGQAGSLTLLFENGTVLDNSTDITAELPAGKICKAVDLFVNATAATASDTVGPVQGVGNAVGGSSLFIHVTAAEGSNSIRMQVLGAGNATAGAAGLKLQLFDGKADRVNDELLVGSWNGTDLLDASNDTAAANTLCVQSDPSVADGSNLILSLDSTLSKYTYAPATPAIAVIAGSSSVSVLKAKGEGLTAELSVGEQRNCSMAYETAAFCEGLAGGLNRYFALQNGGAYPVGDYTVEMEILVNNANGDNGVYFEGATSGIQLTDDLATVRRAFNSTSGSSGHEYYLAGGTKTTKAPVVGCERKDDEKIVKIVSRVLGVPAADANKRYLRVNVPSLAVAAANAGDNVALKITVRQGRCGVLQTATYPLFTLVDACSGSAPAAGGKLLLPYFANAPYWNGLALTNAGTADVDATLTVVDEVGGQGTLDIKVPAQGMYVKLLPAIIGDSAFNGTVDASQRCYIEVAPKSGRLNAFVMMGNDGESMGYIVPNN